MFFHNAFQNKGVFFQLCWLSQKVLLCVLSHILYLSIAASEPWPFPSLWLYNIHTGVTALEHLCVPKAEAEATRAQRPPLLYVICLAQTPGHLQPQVSLAWSRNSQPKRPRGLCVVPAALSCFVHGCRGMGVTEHRLNFCPQPIPLSLPTGSMRQEDCPAGGSQLGFF